MTDKQIPLLMENIENIVLYKCKYILLVNCDEVGATASILTLDSTNVVNLKNEDQPSREVELELFLNKLYTSCEVSMNEDYKHMTAKESRDGLCKAIMEEIKAIKKSNVRLVKKPVDTQG